MQRGPDADACAEGSPVRTAGSAGSHLLQPLVADELEEL